VRYPLQVTSMYQELITHRCTVEVGYGQLLDLDLRAHMI